MKASLAVFGVTSYAILDRRKLIHLLPSNREISFLICSAKWWFSSAWNLILGISDTYLMLTEGQETGIRNTPELCWPHRYSKEEAKSYQPLIFVFLTWLKWCRRFALSFYSQAVFPGPWREEHYLITKQTRIQAVHMLVLRNADPPSGSSPSTSGALEVMWGEGLGQWVWWSAWAGPVLTLPCELHHPLPGRVASPGVKVKEEVRGAVCRSSHRLSICSALDRDLQLSAPPVSSPHNQLTSTSNFLLWSLLRYPEKRRK